MYVLTKVLLKMHYVKMTTLLFALQSVSNTPLLLGMDDNSVNICSDAFQVDASPYSPCPICGDRISGNHS